jgi:hypothetical protein
LTHATPLHSTVGSHLRLFGFFKTLKKMERKITLTVDSMNMARWGGKKDRKDRKLAQTRSIYWKVRRTGVNPADYHGMWSMGWIVTAIPTEALLQLSPAIGFFISSFR